jgi:hypothetical protein
VKFVLLSAGFLLNKNYVNWFSSMDEFPLS